MGVNDREQDKKQAKSEKQRERRRRRSLGGVGGVGADWSGVNGELMAKAVAAVARFGGAVMFGYTRDAGAFTIRIYGDGEAQTEVIGQNDDIEGHLKGIIEDYE